MALPVERKNLKKNLEKNKNKKNYKNFEFFLAYNTTHESPQKISAQFGPAVWPAIGNI